MLLNALPPALDDADALLKRREKASQRKELWRSIYTECYRYAMPARETFTWSTSGQEKNNKLFDSTLQELTYEAANTLCALLFPSWQRWAELSPGGAIPKDKITPQILDGLRKSTEVFFDFLNNSNFAVVINEVALDLMVGTGALSFDEGDNTNPFIFSALPLSALELEEGPDGSIETTFMLRKPTARNVMRMYPGVELYDLSTSLQTAIETSPDKEVEVIQAEVYDPSTKKYFGIAMEVAAKNIFWRYEYGESCPTIVARASKAAGEIYGRGRVMQCLSDARTLDKMQEFVLRHAAQQIAPPLTGVSDGVLNPYTVTLQPNVVIPVASNDNGNPSLRVLDVGGNFNLTEAIMNGLRERLRRAMLGPDMSEGMPKTATEISISDRNRLWAMNGEFSRVQSELLSKIVARGVFILQKKGLIPKFKIDGREVGVSYQSPFAKSQNAQDLMALQQVLAAIAPLGTETTVMGLKTEDIPEWASRKAGLDMSLVRPEEERKQKSQQIVGMAKQAAEQGMPIPGVTA
jgi:hypothetical protein